MLVRKLERFRDATNFMRKIEQGDLDSFGISSRTGRINDERCFVIPRRLERRGISSGIQELLGGKQNDFGTRLCAPSPGSEHR